MAKSDNGAVSAAFEEVTSNPPKVLASTSRKFGAARAHKQKIAIALSKARRAGAKLPNPKMSSKSR